jgi:hypothetical protein
MSVVVVCECRSRFELKDEFAGALVECPNCGRSMTAGGTAVATEMADPLFGRDVYLMSQKVAINERYVVTDEEGAPLLFVERPAHVMRGLLALIVALIASTVAFFALAMLIGPLLPDVAAEDASPVATLIGILVFALVGVVFVVVAMALSKKRHVTFHAGSDESGPRRIEIIQDEKIQFPTRTFTVRDGSGATIGAFSKNLIHSMVRKRWMIRDGRGRPLCFVREDSIILSLIRRIGAFVPILRLMRTNFVFFKFGSDRELGEFRRKRTLLDKYVLDLQADPTRILDRRLAVAMAVMLDTAERR